MQLSTRSRYGIRAMLDLALNHGGPPVKRQDIAARQEIPEAYLVQLFVALRNHGLVKTLRGPSGGHLLSRDPREITILHVVNAFESDSGDADSESDLIADKVITILWSEVENHRKKVLGETTLGDLARQYQENIESSMFHI